MSGPLVLLVEDNSDDEALALEALRLRGITRDMIWVSRDGQEAVDYLQQASAAPAPELPLLVLLDLKLPKLSGFEVLERIRADARTKLLPVVMFTSSCLEQDIINSYQRGANSYMCKPVDFNEYTEVVKQLEAYWLKWNRVAPPQRRA